VPSGSIVLRIAAVAFIVASGSAATAQERRPFSEILNSYRTADADAAAREFARWSHQQVERQARLSARQIDDPWARAALALLHLEAGLANGTFDGIAPDVRVVRTGNMEDLEIHARTAYRLMSDLTRQAAATKNGRLLEFCRQWYLAAWSTGRSFEPPIADDPVFLLIKGRVQEYWTGPAITPAGGLIGLIDPADEPGGVLKTTSQGQVSLRFASEAQRTLRRALELAPQLAEAHLRLGRIAYLLDDRDDAERHWMSAVSSATNGQDVFSGYLAHLFLGQLAEDRGRRNEATVLYRKALQWLPSGQVAMLAHSRLQIEAGDELDGWSQLGDRLRMEGSRVPVDPWYAYGTYQGPWARGARIHRLREMVRP
jgi:tetratricopeptide (TPR) repeat protein